MLRFQIPKNSIKNKLLMSGIDTSIIDLDPEGPVPEHLLDNDEQKDLNFGEISLNRVTVLDKIKKETNFKVPSLDDILKGRAKTNKL